MLKRHLMLMVFLGAAVFGATENTSFAQQSTDFLKASGAPVTVARALEKGLRKAVMKQGKYRLLANPMAPTMIQLTLGCQLDSSACVKRLGAMRKAKIIFHLNVLPFGSRAKAIFRKLNGTTGATIKSVSYRFRKRKIKKALGVLTTKMFGGTGAAPRRTPPPARRPVVVARRIPPVVRRAVEPVKRRVAPPVRRAVATVKRVAPPVVRRVVEPVKRRVAPPVRRAVAIAKRTIPPTKRIAVVPVRRPAVVVKRTTPPVKRIIERRTPPKRLVATIGTKTKPKQAPSTPLLQRPSFWAWVCVGVAVASAGGMLAFGLDANSKGEQLNQLIRDSQQGKEIRYNETVKPLQESGETSAVLANVFIGVAAASAVTAAVLFLIPPPKTPTATTKLPPSSKSTNVAHFTYRSF